jgi:plastocyanin
VNVWKMAIVAAGSALALAACGGSSGGGGGGGSACNPTGGSTSGTGNTVVKVVPDPNTVGKFDPTTVTVSAGQSVEWDFTDTSSPHTVTADDGSFDSCSQNAGFKFIVTFSKAGDVKYHCTLHAQMLGDLKVS